MRQAQNLVTYRNAHGRLVSRQQLLQIEGLGEKTFQQAAGFLRIKDGEQILDRYGRCIPKPMQWSSAWRPPWLSRSRLLVANAELINSLDLQQFVDAQVGALTLQDIREELLKPGRDPRAQFVMAHFRDDVTSLEHLQEGMMLEGMVSNVTNFGAFVDIGVHQDGLVHISELSQRYVRDPREVVQVGQVVKVRVLSVDVALQRISLSMKGLRLTPGQSETPRQEAAGQRGNGSRGGGQRDGGSGTTAAEESHPTTQDACGPCGPTTRNGYGGKVTGSASPFSEPGTVLSHVPCCC